MWPRRSGRRWDERADRPARRRRVAVRRRGRHRAGRAPARRAGTGGRAGRADPRRRADRPGAGPARGAAAALRRARARPARRRGGQDRGGGRRLLGVARAGRLHPLRRGGDRSGAARPPTSAASSPRPGCAASGWCTCRPRCSAMVDAAVGGKTGINTGCRQEPRRLLPRARRRPVRPRRCCATLPREELVAGLGEVVKCGFIADPAILDLVESTEPDTLDRRLRRCSRELVERAIRVKIDVVVADLKETGGVGGHPGREVLNYGHTLAHAIERAEDYGIRHGEAVAIGCVYVAELAARAGTLARRAGRAAPVGLRPGRPADVVLRRGVLRRAAGRDERRQEGPRLTRCGSSSSTTSAGPRVLVAPAEDAAAWRRTTRSPEVPREGARAQRAQPGPARAPAARDLRHHHARRARRALRRVGPRARPRGRGAPDQPRGRAARLAQRRRRRRRRRSSSTPARGRTTPGRSSTPAPSSPRRWSRCTSATPRSGPRSSGTPPSSTPHAVATIAGHGVDGYRQALEVIAAR